MPKALGFQWKKASLGVRSLWTYQCTCMPLKNYVIWIVKSCPFFLFFFYTNQFTYMHLIWFFPIFQILSDFYAFKSIGLRKPFLVLKVEYWVGLLSSKSNFFTNKISKGRKSVREKSTFLPTFAFNTKIINSRKGFFRKLHFCTFYCINPGFGGPWDIQ